jgi:AraC-like DNA-binding protein
MTLFILHRPSSTLHPYVSGYWRVSDRAGAYRGRPIDTAPRPGAVLTVNIGQPNRSSDGDLTPTLSLLGVQTQARSWRSDFDTDFIMALLTPLGLARLFPGCASGVANSRVDAGSVVGDRAAAALLNEASARPDSLVAALDEWLLARLTAARVTGSIDLFQAASRELANASRVSVAAETLGVTRRHLSRLVREHLGIGPKELLDLHRLDRSLSAVQAGCEGGAGFSDQAHQIREWRRRLRTTPGRYARGGRSPLAETFGGVDPSVTYYL